MIQGSQLGFAVHPPETRFQGLSPSITVEFMHSKSILRWFLSSDPFKSRFLSPQKQKDAESAPWKLKRLKVEEKG